jgi:hypothetical protein
VDVQYVWRFLRAQNIDLAARKRLHAWMQREPLMGWSGRASAPPASEAFRWWASRHS